MKPFHSESTFENTFDDDFPAIPDVSVPQVLTDEKITDVPEQIPVADSISRILDKTITRRDAYYLVQFAGQPLHEASWIPGSESLLQCSDLVEKFEAKRC